MLLVYNYYSMFNKMVSSLKTFDDEKIFVNTEALKSLWSNLQSNIKILNMNNYSIICILTKFPKETTETRSPLFPK